MMDDITDGFGAESISSPPSSHPVRPEPVTKPPNATEQRVNLQEWDVSTDSADSHVPTSTSPSSNDLEIDKNREACEKMEEKWRLIRLADKNTARKKVDDAKACI